MEHLSKTMSSLGFFLLLVFGWTHSQMTNNTRPVFKCGGNLDGDSGFVASEDFPSYYKPNSKCTWYITVPEGNVVMLSFRIFDLEADTLCRYDFVDVYNGHSNVAQKLGRFCGTFRPGTLISTSSTMMLQMESDSATGGRGFLAHFSAAKPHLNEQQFCGGKMTKPHGTIHTPNWPEKNYPPGISCSWLITVDPDKVIEVKFDKFDVERDTYCRFDYVAFYNGVERDDSRRIGKFCGDKAPEPIVTNSNVLLVQFVSDQSVTSDGFIALYSSVPRGYSVQPGSRVHSLPTVPRLVPAPAATRKPITTTTTEAPITTTTTATSRRRPPANPNQPARPPNRRPESGRPNPVRPDPNPLCPKTCKRDGSIKTSFCSSEFVITGTVNALSQAPQGRLLATVSIIKAYKAGGLTISQSGETMTVKLVLMCKTCPVLRRGQSFILMGQVDEDGRGILPPGSFTAMYKAPHHKILTSLNNQPC
ncbi:procollagen C-endopeptidase enhancer a [Ictalurus furcatus]|uniref:procollagen C-endopeptidase enhancer a n=1 Tax=Ictalurus furcatus TaxID=66913 RepID=UPI0023509178|nr:procollagen C-endopeptidase enhancer a [Ictalurus furcatus]